MVLVISAVMLMAMGGVLFWYGGAIAFGIVSAAVVVLLVWYYHRMTYYPIAPIEPEVTFEGPDLGFFYMHVKGARFRHHYVSTDEEGFAILNVYGKWYRQPVSHCHLTMNHYNDYMETGDTEARKRFLQSTDLLLHEMQTVELGGRECNVWYYSFEIPWYAPHPHPWVSCLVQARAMVVLCRAYLLTKDDKYLEAARGAMSVFRVHIADGGVLDTDPEGHIYYEEYPFPGKAYHVLNGFIDALLGLYDVLRVTGDGEAKMLFDDGIATLLDDGVLRRYDLGYWTTYDQRPGPNRSMAYKYNRKHVRQLRVLYKITGRELFRETADKWAAYNLKHRYRIRFLLRAASAFLANTHIRWRVLLPWRDAAQA